MLLPSLSPLSLLLFYFAPPSHPLFITPRRLKYYFLEEEGEMIEWRGGRMHDRHTSIIPHNLTYITN